MKYGDQAWSKQLYETWLKIPEAVASHLHTSTETYGVSAVSIIVNKFVTQTISNTERNERGISLIDIEHTVSCIREKCADLHNCNQYRKCYSP